MSDNTPTTDDVRELYVDAHLDDYQGRAGERFDRMIAQVQAEALREFARSIPGDVHDPRHVADLARGVADHIEKEAGL